MIRHNSWFGTGALLLLGVCLLSGAASAADDSQPPRIQILSAEVAEDYDSLFLPQERGFLGADGAASVSLTRNKVLWLFGDTFLGVISPDGQRKCVMVRNSIALQHRRPGDQDRVEYYWNLTDRLPYSFFLSEGFDQKYWYWPGCGVLIDGNLYVFNYKVRSGEGDHALAFEPGGMVLIRVRNPLDDPLKWKMDKYRMDIGSQSRNFTSAAYVEKPYVYLLGHDDIRIDGEHSRRMVLARMLIRDLKRGKGREAMEFWTENNGGSWSPEPDNLKPLFSPGTTESSLHYDSELGLYLSVTHDYFKPEIYVTASREITGPWSEPVLAYRVPEMALNDDYHAYAVKVHPELHKQSGELVITYVVNSKDFWGVFSTLDIYYPRFIRVHIGLEP